MNIIIPALVIILDLTVYLAQLQLYFYKAIFVGLIKADIYLMAGLDAVFDEELSANPIVRMLVTGVIGFALAFTFISCVTAALGNWFVSFMAILIILFACFLGLLADPSKNWELGDPPRWGSYRGPDVPLNL